MDKDFFIQLTNNLYRLTMLFPKKEPLRYKIRELADDILASPSQEDFEILNNFLEVAKEQNWVKPDDILFIQKEYDRMGQELLKEELKIQNDNSALKEELERQPQISFSEPHFNGSKFSERHEKILAFLKEEGRAQVWQIKQILPDVSKRTLRRDFECLVNQGIIERIGERNSTFYQVKMSQS
jgi:predicted HTH transcriptional regulator